MRIRPSDGTLIAARQSRTSPTVTSAALRSRNMSERSERCHDCLAIHSAIASTEFDKTIASPKPRCSATRRVRSTKEMPHNSVSASGESATINNGGREGFVILAAERVFGSLHQAGTHVARTLGGHVTRTLYEKILAVRALDCSVRDNISANVSYAAVTSSAFRRKE